MMGVRSGQQGLPEADHLYLDYGGRGSFYGFLVGDGYSETKSSPNYITETLAAIVCLPIWWPPRGG